MSVARGATRRKRLFMGLALLAGLLTIGAACGGGGEPKAAPTGTAAQSAQQFASSTATPTVAGKATTTPAPATATPAATAAAGTGTATGTTPVVVGYDMDPTGNDATTLGNIDRCVEVSAGQQFQVDVFLNGLPSGDSVAGVGYTIGFPDSVAEIVAQDPQFLLAAVPGSNVQDLGDAAPGTTNPHVVSIVDFGSGTGETNPPYAQGVLGRYTMQILTTTSPGVYALTLDDVVVGQDIPPGGGIPVDQIWDAKFAPQYGVIAVDVSCDVAAAAAN